MIQTPKRTSLVAQVADILREGLRKREWVDHLPGERRLCSELKVSRTTVRKALAQLSRDGLVEISHGLSSKIIAPPKRHLILPSHAKVVGILATKPLYEITGHALYLISELQNRLHDLGYGLAVCADRRLNKKHARKVLEDVVLRTKASCWVLMLSNEQIQKWFMDQKVPAIVLGSCFDGIHLPSFDVDDRALGQHAAGVFLRKGHRRVALLMAKTSLAGDLVCEQAFREAFLAPTYPDASLMPVHHDGMPNGVQSAVTTLFQSQHPPTGVFVSHAQHVITLVSQLVNLGVRIPHDVSVISRDDDLLLSFLVPPLARYTVDRTTFVARCCRLVIQMATSQALPARQVRIMPDFLFEKSIALPKA